MNIFDFNICLVSRDVSVPDKRARCLPSSSCSSWELVLSYSRLAFVGLRLRTGEGPAVDF